MEEFGGDQGQRLLLDVPGVLFQRQHFELLAENTKNAIDERNFDCAAQIHRWKEAQIRSIVAAEKVTTVHIATRRTRTKSARTATDVKHRYQSRRMRGFSSSMFQIAFVDRPHPLLADSHFPGDLGLREMALS
jgi:hypothetical protein